jgi:CheY-like chemotaxis protein
MGSSSTSSTTARSSGDEEERVKAVADQDTWDLNQRLAFVCIDDADRRTAVSSALGALGYRAEQGGKPDDVLERLRRQTYEVIVIDESFQGSTAEDHPVLRHLQWLPMTVRRYMFVTLLAPGVKTFDNLLAFSKSVNLIVNYADVAQIQPILQRGIADNDEFYRVFRQVLQEVGKR